MHTVYQTSDSLEAHMMLNLLQQENIDAQVVGQHLQGAMGEVPAVGYIRLVVDLDDEPRAMKIIQEWEQAQPPLSPTQKQDVVDHAKVSFIVGLIVGVLLTLIITSQF